MENSKVRGIVCKITEYGEADKIITILSFERGKISLIAKGVKKPKAALSHATRLFYCGTFEFTGNKKLPILIGARQIQDFFQLTTSLEKLYYASHFMEVASFFIQEEQAAEEEMSLLLNSLYLLMKDKADPLFLTAILQFRIVALEGLAPITDTCVHCSKDLHESSSFCFSLDYDGISCCNHGTCISKGVYQAIDHICSQDASKIFFFSIDKKDILSLYELSRSYLEKTSGRAFQLPPTLNNL